MKMKALGLLLLAIVVLGSAKSSTASLLSWAYLPVVVGQGEPSPTPRPTLVPFPFPSGDFEDGTGGSWTEYSDPPRALVSTYEQVFGISHLERYGFWLAWLGGELTAIEQELIIPGISLLCLEYMIYSEQDVSTDQARLLFNGIEQAFWAIIATNSKSQFQVTCVDLPSWWGKEVIIRLEATGLDSGSFYVDNVRFSDTVPELPVILYVANFTGGEMCYLVHDSGIGWMCYVARDWEENFYGLLSPGSYEWVATTAVCGSFRGVSDWAAGIRRHRFVCPMSN